MEKYFLILENLLVKGIFEEDSTLASEAYKFTDGYWVEMERNEINDRLMGYDPTEDDQGWALGNTEIMDEIRELSDEELTEELEKRFESLHFIFTIEELSLMEQFASYIGEAFDEASEEEKKNYDYFYFKDKRVVNPWMDEDRTSNVNPFEYYGRETFEEQLIRLALSIDPEKSDGSARPIVEKCKKSQGAKEMAFYKETVYFAMSEEQADEEGCTTCFGPELPGIYYGLSSIPSELAVCELNEWEKRVSFTKENAEKVMNFLYPEGIPFDYEQYINRIHGDTCWLEGFGD